MQQANIGKLSTGGACSQEFLLLIFCFAGYHREVVDLRDLQARQVLQDQMEIQEHLVKKE